MLSHPPDDLPMDYRRITNLYLNSTRLRLRKVESPAGETLSMKLTQKYFADNVAGIDTVTANIYLNQQELQQLRSLKGNEICKRCYTHVQQDAVWAIDVVEGELTGLVLAEIELPVGEPVPQIVPPANLLAEVTDVDTSTGEHLALANSHVITAEVEALRTENAA